MSEQIKQILTELYMLDKDLKKYEKELEKIVSELLSMRPDVKVNEVFVSELRAELSKRAERLSAKQETKSGNLFSAFKFSYAFGSVALVAVLVFSVVLWQGQQKSSLVFNSGVTKVADRAFGPLSDFSESGEPQALGVGNGEDVTMVAGKGGGGEMARMPAPSSIAYKYIYQGDEFNVEDTQMDVSKRIKNTEIGKAFAQYITNINTDLISLSNLQNVNIESLNLVEDREFGYSVYFNFRDGSASISQNWEKWPNPYTRCAGDQKCYEESRLSIDDVPADEEIVKIADQFVADYGIDMTMYGNGEVQDIWRINYDRANIEEKASEAYVPDTIAVMYPLMIDGEVVYDQSGNKSGMHISVDLRQKKVSNAGSLRAQMYESSSYDIENDAEKLIAYAEEGGAYKMYTYGEPEKTVDVMLGTPEQGLIQMYSYNEDKRDTDEYYIPSLIFPVESISDGSVYFYRQAVIVPLVPEIIESMNGGGVRPMPLLEVEVQ